ncbi:MAG: DUF2887 domain-containing protein [Rhizobacter sp.]|nr:DUF2887 domain-containing protein [Chlorobiales bacterium]
MYLKQNRIEHSWRAVVVYPNRKVESERIVGYEVLLNSHHYTRVYLDELEPETLELGIVKLVIEPEKSAMASAQRLIEQAKVSVEE